MANSLKNAVRELADQFVSEVFAAIEGATLGNLAESLGGLPARPASQAAAKAQPPAARRGTALPPAKSRRTRNGGRRSSEEVHTLQSKVVSIIGASSGGIAISEVAKKLGLNPADITRPLALALSARQIKKTGEKRMTRYFPGRG